MFPNISKKFSFDFRDKAFRFKFKIKDFSFDYVISLKNIELEDKIYKYQAENKENIIIIKMIDSELDRVVYTISYSINIEHIY